MKTAKEYPLVWPEGWARTPKGKRKPGKFLSQTRTAITYYGAEQRVMTEVGRLVNGAKRSVICSSNMIRDRQPDDPGVAVYFESEGQPMRVIAIDIYTRVEDNLAAVAATIEAMRAIERHGGATILERAFKGFDALPAPKSCWAILGVPEFSNEDDVQKAWKAEITKAHTDAGGGSHARAAEVNAARDECLRRLRA